MQRKFIKTLLGTAVVATAAITGFGQDAKAANFPCSTAQLIVPWGPGGGTAVLFGIFENYLNSHGANPKIKVVTMPGQGGNKGAKEAVKKKPDGCTLFAIHQSALTSYLQGRVPFNWDAFDTVAHLTITPSFLAGSPKSPFNTHDEMLAALKKGKVKTGASMGATSHFIWLRYGEATGTSGSFQFVPIQGGTGKRKGLLLNDTIQIAEMNEAAAGKEMSSGALKPFAIAAVKRSAKFPNVPTLREKGINLLAALNRGIVVPKGTPKAVIDHWAATFKKAVDDPEFVKKIAAKGTGLQYMGPADYAKWFAAEAKLFAGIYAKIKK
jgi:tripartite-type tricarboxylate transporter receptor subunit TctC